MVATSCGSMRIDDLPTVADGINDATADVDRIQIDVVKREARCDSAPAGAVVDKDGAAVTHGVVVGAFAATRV